MAKKYPCHPQSFSPPTLAPNVLTTLKTKTFGLSKSLMVEPSIKAILIHKSATKSHVQVKPIKFDKKRRTNKTASGAIQSNQFEIKKDETN